MKVGQMKRQQVYQAMERRQQAALTAGETEAAERIGEDLVTLRKARGNTLYDMYRNADRRHERHMWLTTGECIPTFAATGAGIGAVAGLAFAATSQQSLLGGLVLGGVLGGTGGLMTTLMFANPFSTDPGRPIMEALDRSAGILRQELQNPTQGLPNVSRTEVLGHLRAQQQDYVSRGHLSDALELEKAVKEFSGDRNMTLGELHIYAIEERQGAVVRSLHQLLKSQLSEQEVKNLVAGSAGLDEASVDWLEQTIEIGDQSLPVN